MDRNDYELSKKRYAYNCLCLRIEAQLTTVKVVNSTASGHNDHPL